MECIQLDLVKVFNVTVGEMEYLHCKHQAKSVRDFVFRWGDGGGADAVRLRGVCVFRQ